MQTSVGLRRPTVAILAALVAAATLSASAPAKMRSERLATGGCETTGGGRFVNVPGFPGEQIDRRLLTDIRWLQKRYSIYVTDGYSLDDVHAANGEHPLGLALDIVPDKASGGRWSDINHLARWAEPSQDHPRFPFRWVGYDGDANHGRGHHLHLSWAHSPAKFGKPARTVYTIRCPKPAAVTPTPPPLPPPPAEPVAPPPPPPTGGVGGKLPAPVIESGGISAP